jgi:SAM-dependent methyltransferase
VPNGATILDVGCGYGSFLEEMALRNYVAIGVEPSDIRREAARRLASVTVFRDVVEVPSSLTADLVNLFHVLEHLRSPVSFLRQLSQHLSPMGEFVVVVPNIRDHLLRRNTAYRAFYWQLPHLSYFSEETLRYCLELAGYACRELQYVQRWGVANAMHWMLHDMPQQPASVLRAATMSGFEWLDTAYEKHLARTRCTDTLLVRARRRHD